MIFRQLYDATSSTYTYLLADEHSREAMLIDPVFEQFHRDLALLRETVFPVICPAGGAVTSTSWMWCWPPLSGVVALAVETASTSPSDHHLPCCMSLFPVPG